MKKAEIGIGIKRDLDDLGRLVIPKEFRTMYALENEVEIVATEEGVLIRNPEYILVKKSEAKKGSLI